MTKAFFLSLAALVACSPATVARRPAPTGLPPAQKQAHTERDLQQRAAREAAFARVTRSREALQVLKSRYGADMVALDRVAAELESAEKEAADPQTYTLFGTVTGYERGAVFVFGNAVPDSGRGLGPGVLMDGPAVLIDPKQSEITMNKLVVANRLYFRGHFRGVNAFGIPMTAFAYSHVQPKQTAKQAAAIQRVRALRWRKAALEARVQPVLDEAEELEKARAARDAAM